MQPLSIFLDTTFYWSCLFFLFTNIFKLFFLLIRVIFINLFEPYYLLFGFLIFYYSYKENEKNQMVKLVMKNYKFPVKSGLNSSCIATFESSTVQTLRQILEWFWLLSFFFSALVMATVFVNGGKAFFNTVSRETVKYRTSTLVLEGCLLLPFLIFYLITQLRYFYSTFLGFPAT